MSKSISAKGVESSVSGMSEMLSMQMELRQAIFNSITDADVVEIIKKQVEKAKEGDERSLQFVMKYVLGFGTPVTLQQINIHGDTGKGGDDNASSH